MMEKFIDIITSEKVYLPIVYILIGIILNIILGKIVNKFTCKHKSSSGKDKRKDTIINLGKNIFKYLILIFVVLGILNLYGVDTTSIIASLGVFAAVIGLAFQDIIKDFLAGVTIIFDNKYAVGDTIEINGFMGTVISLGLRTTKIKSASGEIKCIGNASFSEVVNYNLADTDLFIKLNVAYDTDIDKLEKVLLDLKDDVLAIEDVKDYNLLGIDELGSSSIVYMIEVKCKAMAQYAIKRKIFRIVKDKFDVENIKIPFTTIEVNVRK